MAVHRGFSLRCRLSTGRKPVRLGWVLLSRRLEGSSEIARPRVSTDVESYVDREGRRTSRPRNDTPALRSAQVDTALCRFLMTGGFGSPLLISLRSSTEVAEGWDGE